MKIKRPFPDMYQVRYDGLALTQPPQGVLLAGAYPAVNGESQARRRAPRFLTAGVTSYVDLTEPEEGGLRPYFPIFQYAAAAAGQTLTHHRLSIPDMRTPDVETVHAILDVIDTALFRGETVYVHCYGGIGRTGTIIGCWLVRYGLSGAEALRRLAHWRRKIPSGRQTSPETGEQQQRVLTWQRGA